MMALCDKRVYLLCMGNRKEREGKKKETIIVEIKREVCVREKRGGGCMHKLIAMWKVRHLKK